jgi:hypothetical protein
VKTNRHPLRQLGDTLDATLGIREFPDSFVYAGWTWSRIDVDECCRAAIAS